MYEAQLWGKRLWILVEKCASDLYVLGKMPRVCAERKAWSSIAAERGNGARALRSSAKAIRGQ